MMRAALALTSVFTLLSACDAGPDLNESIETQAHSSAPSAHVVLSQGVSTIKQMAWQQWSLSKTGAVDPAASTITWDLAATRSSATSRQLVVSGRVVVKNTGNAPATVGSVVVNLQHKPHNKWITVASNVADGTSGDAATSAKIVAGNAVKTITESAASGRIALRRAISNHPISLAPQKSIPRHTTIPVELMATFDNGLLNLPKGRKVRAEVIVTYGNAGPGSGSATYVDIDGSGGLEPDEDRVKSEAEDLGQKTVPSPTSSTPTVTLTDTLDDVETTGTVEITSAVFDVGATTGTVTVTYAAGADGGTITNCAHLTGSGVDLEACDTQTIEAEPFEWHDGDVVTYSQESWTVPPGSTALSAYYNTVYAATSGILEVGLSGAAGYSMLFTSAPNVLAYLPEIGPSGPLTSDLLNPTATVGGVFAADVTALQLDVSFADAEVLGGTAGIAFGDLTMCDFPTLPLLEGMTVRAFVAELNVLLGGGTATYTIGQLFGLATDLSRSFDGGIVGTFATDHLVIGACP